MRNWIIFMAALILASVPFSGTAVPDDAGRPTIVEISPPLPPPPPGVLSTVGYSPTEKEKPFLEKITEKVPDKYIFLPDDAEKPISSTKEAGYSLTAAEGKYVGWFGIVREISRDSPAGATRLLIEHQYFDGMTDSHLQVVAYFGAGDFIAWLKGSGFDIPLLSLVCVYGTVETSAAGLPQVTADYIRVWDWGRFTFMAYGEDKSNPRWIKLRRVKGEDAYSPRPTRRFYEERLGERAVARKAAGEGIPVTILYTAESKGYFLPSQAGESQKFMDPKLTPGDRYGGYAAIAAYIKRVREEVEGRGGVLLIVDGGNSLVGSVEANFFLGRSSVEFMNRMGYNSITISNRDWSLGTGVVEEMATKSSFAFLGANVVETDTGLPPPYLKPYVIVEDKGLKIGIIGYAQRRLSKWVDISQVKGLKGERPKTMARKYIDEMRQQGVNLVVAVDHTAGKGYLEMARTVEGIDILINGAANWTSVYTTGFSLEAPMKIKETHVFPEVDSHFAVGRIDLVYDRDEGKIIEARGKRHFMNLKEVPEDPEIKDLVDGYTDKMGGQLQDVIGYATDDLTIDWDENWNTSLGRVVCEAMRQHAKTDVAIENLGAIRNYIKKGPIHLRDIEDILPFKNNLVTFKVKGRYIYGCKLIQSRSGGDRFPCIYVSGAVFDRNPNLKVTHITIGGKEIEKNRDYTFATNSYMYNTKYLDDRVCKDIRVRDEDINDIVTDYIKQHSPIAASVDK